MTDLESRSIDEFKAYLKKYTGPSKRFLEPVIAASGKVKISHRSLLDLMRYVLNYIQHDGQCCASAHMNR